MNPLLPATQRRRYGARPGLCLLLVGTLQPIGGHVPASPLCVGGHGANRSKAEAADWLQRSSADQ